MYTDHLDRMSAKGISIEDFVKDFQIKVKELVETVLSK